MRLVNRITEISFSKSSQKEVPVKPRWPTLLVEKYLPALEFEEAGVSKPKAQVLAGCRDAGRKNSVKCSLDQGTEVFLPEIVSNIQSRTHLTS